MGADRQTENLCGKSFSDRIVPSLTAQKRVGVGEVRWNRIVSLRADPMRREVRLESVTVHRANDEKMPHRLHFGRHEREREVSDAAELLEVARGENCATSVP